jgi:hypothetical protein
VELEGTHSKRPKNKPFCAIKNFTSRRHFLVTYFLLLKKSNWLEGIQVKNHHADAARDDGAKRAFKLLKRMNTGVHCT